MSKTRRTPAKAAQILGAVMAFLLALCVFATVLLGTADRVLTDRALHVGIATAPEVLAAERSYIDDVTDRLAEKYGFAKETVSGALDDAALTAYAGEVVDWWMGMLGEEPSMTAPAVELDELETALTEDPGLQAEVAAARLTKTVREKIIPELETAMTKAVLPVQSKVLAMGVAKVLKAVDVPRLVSLLHTWWPAAGAAAVLLALLIALLMGGHHRWLWLAGSGILAGGLLTAGAGACVLAIRLTEQITELSPRMGLQVSLLLKELGTPWWLAAAGCAVLGTVMIALHQRRRAEGQTA